MPQVIVEIAEGPTLDQKRAMAKGITNVITEVYGVEPRAVTVMFHVTPRTDKAVGGVLFSELPKKS